MAKRIIYSKFKFGVTALLLLLAVSCSNDLGNGEEEGVASVNFSIITRSVNDPITVNSDDTFGSLALYIFHESQNSPQYVALIPAFSPTSLREWSRTIQVLSGNKTVYVVANYNGAVLKNSAATQITLSTTTTKAQLEDLIAYNASGFSSTNLLMVCKNSFNVGSTEYNKSVTMPLRRLQARIDLHVYKGSSLSSQAVTLKSVTLTNLMHSSEVKYIYNPSTALMPTPLQPYIYLSGPLNIGLDPYPGLQSLNPSNAFVNLYSYQNMVTISNPLPSNVPVLVIVASYGTSTYTYTAKLTDNSQTNYKYSLLQNQVYSVSAVLQAAGNIIVDVSAAPWGVQGVDTQRPVTSSDCKLSAWNSSWGGTNAKTIHTVNNTYADATFSFELKAPESAAWTATLTNGLDFQFVNATGGVSTTAVSRGSTRPGVPYLIAVRATKPWNGTIRQTEMFITVNGVEIPINPLTGATRPFPGSSNSRVVIKQVYSTAY